MIWITALHFAQFWLALTLADGLFTEQQKREILDLHNMYRSNVVPEAAGMIYMTWNKTLAAVAERYTSQCIWEHNPEVKQKFGENMHAITGSLNISWTMADWFKEYQYYDYNLNHCNPTEMCGHYTQMVWAKTTSVGCASYFCETIKVLDYKKATIVVCNYYPRGNVMENRPYESGNPCSKCPMSMPRCVNKTCGPSAVQKAVGSTWLPKPSEATLLLLLLLLAGLMAL